MRMNRPVRQPSGRKLKFRIVPLGDQALIVELADQIELEPVRRIHSAGAWLADPALPGVSESVPAATTITLFYSATEVVDAGAPAADVPGWLGTRVRERLATLPGSEKAPAARR